MSRNAFSDFSNEDMKLFINTLRKFHVKYLNEAKNMLQKRESTHYFIEQNEIIVITFEKADLFYDSDKQIYFSIRKYINEKTFYLIFVCLKINNCDCGYVFLKNNYYTVHGFQYINKNQSAFRWKNKTLL